MTKSAKSTSLISLALGLLLLGLLLLAERTPASPDQLAQLRSAVERAEAALQLAGLGCEVMVEPAARADCHAALDGASVPVRVARGVLQVAEACQEGDAGESCRATQIAQAEQLLPEVRRIAEQLAAPTTSASGEAAGTGGEGGAGGSGGEGPEPPASALPLPEPP